MDPLLIMMLLAVGAMFLLTNRTRKQQAKAAQVRQNLAIGDEVMTGSGLFGTIIDIDGDVITLESPSGAQTDWLRAAISKHATPPYAEPLEDDEAVSDEDVLDEDVVDEDADLLEDDGAATTADRVDDAEPGTGTSAPRAADAAEDVRRHP